MESSCESAKALRLRSRFGSRRQHPRRKNDHVRTKSQIQLESCLEADCWLGVLRCLEPHNLTKYAMLCSAARRLTEQDLLWEPFVEREVEVKDEILDDVRESDSAKPTLATPKNLVRLSLKAIYLARQRLLCVECRQPTRYFSPLLGVRLCPHCEAHSQASHGNPYELCSKSDAKQIFLLEARDLRLFPSIKRSSPWATKSAELRLYLRSVVENFAIQKFGGAEALEEARRQRRIEGRLQGSSSTVLRRTEFEVRVPKNSILTAPQPAPSMPASAGSSSDADDHAGSKASEPSSWDTERTNEASTSSEHASRDTECSLLHSGSAAESSDAADEGCNMSSSTHLFKTAQRELAAAQRKEKLQAKPQPLGLQIESASPFTVRQVTPRSIADRQLGIQVGDQLLAVAGTYCTMFQGGWPAIKVALSQRPVKLLFQRVYHQYQKGAMAPGQSRKSPTNLQRTGRSSCCRPRSGSGNIQEAEDPNSGNEGAAGSNLATRKQTFGQWSQHQPWQEVDYLAMGVSGLEVKD